MHARRQAWTLHFPGAIFRQVRVLLLCSLLSLAAHGGSKPAPCRKPSACAAQCESGVPVACFTAATLMLNAKGSAKSTGQAAEPLERGCQLGELRACHLLSRLRARGLTGTMDEAGATALLQTACEGGHALSCAELGLRFALARGAGANPALGATLLVRGQKAAAAACKAGDGLACVTLASAQREGLLPGGAKAAAPLQRSAVTLLRKRCNNEEPLSCGELGALLAEGWTGPVDAFGARPLLQRACEEGDAPACHRLAAMHAEGVGGKVDLVRANALEDLACQRGVALSCAALAARLKDEPRAAALQAKAMALLNPACERGEGPACFALASLDASHARELYQRASPALRQRCERGDGRACRAVALDLIEGLSGNINLSAGYNALRRACDVGEPKSCYELAERYATGDARDLDTRRALALHRHGCELGHTPACAQASALAQKPVVTASALSARCPAGQVVDDDAPSRCCWPGQVWSSKDRRCLGPPACPADRVLEGEGCVCPGGRVTTAEGLCCWPGQTGSLTAGTCVGSANQCPPSHLLRNGTCEALAACEGGLVASQATAGRCCWPGQRWASDRCTGRPTACASEWVPSGEQCVPGVERVWQYLVAAVGQAAFALVPVDESLQHRVSVVRVLSGASCQLRLSEETAEYSPRFKGGHTRVMRETSIALAKVTAVGVTESPDAYARAGSEYYLSVTAPGIVLRTASYNDSWDSENERYELAQNAKDEGGAETWGRSVSLPGGAAEAAKALAAAARACGANPEVNAGPGGDLTAERGELSRRLTLQINARAEGARQLSQEGGGAAARAAPSTGSLADALMTGVTQGQAYLAQSAGLRVSPPGFGAVPKSSGAQDAAAPREGGGAVPARGAPDASTRVEQGGGAVPARGAPRDASGESEAARGASVELSRSGAPAVQRDEAETARGASVELSRSGAASPQRGEAEAARLAHAGAEPASSGAAAPPAARVSVGARAATPSPPRELSAVVAPRISAPEMRIAPRRSSEEQPCVPAAGNSCWFAPAGDACPTYPTQSSCDEKHGRCTERAGQVTPSC